MDRRSFIKLGSATAVAGLTGSCGQIAQKIIPFAIPPDEGINPVEGWWYNTTCGMCDAGCGVKVRIVEGRAKKIEGNPNHPVNNGGVCARGQAAVQQLYHPERIKTPMVRDGAKGSNSFKPVTWDEAIALLTANMKKGKEKGSYVLAGSSTDMNAAIAGKVLANLGSDSFAVPGINGTASHVAASRTGSGAPYYQMADAGSVLLLGADIFESGFSPVHFSWAYGQMRGNKDITRRGQLIYAGSRLSMTAANADHFIAAKQGTLGNLANAVAHEVLNMVNKYSFLKNIPAVEKSAWVEALQNDTPEAATRITGVAGKDVARIAKTLVEHLPSVVIPGEDLASHTNGVDSLKAVNFLNFLLVRIAAEQGIHSSMPATDTALYEKIKNFIGVSPSVMEYSALKKVAAKAKTAALGIIINSDPVHTTPPQLKMKEALSETRFVAQFGCFLNSTSLYADLVLPDLHFLESWSAQVVDYPHGVPVLNTIQPVVNPDAGIIQSGDVLIKASAKAGAGIGVANTEELIREMIRSLQLDIGLEGHNENKVWEKLLQNGGWWDDAKNGDADKRSYMSETVEPVAISNAGFAGGTEFSFYLHPYRTVNIGDGSSANLPWLQEMPEPMTTLCWTSWVEINPKAALKEGIHDGDILKVESPFGSIEAPAYIYPGIGPDTIAVPFGYGHSSFGHEASGRGANPMNLIGDFAINGMDEPAYRGIRVKITKTGRKKKMVREGHPEGQYETEVFQL